LLAIRNLKRKKEGGFGVETIANETVAVPKEEYRVLKEIYQSVKRQHFLLRIAEAEKNLKAGKIKKVTVDKFIEQIG
jgi:predicted transcriptional regulator